MQNIHELYPLLAHGTFEISPKELQSVSWQDLCLVDVRNASEWQEGFINGAINIPLMRLLMSAPYELEANKVIVTYCHSGNRSSLAAKQLRSLGFQSLTLEGGIENWRVVNGK